MSVPEVVWRVRGRLTDVIDRVALSGRSKDLPLHHIAEGNGRGETQKVTPVWETGNGSSAGLSENHVPEQWRAEAVIAADRVAEHRLALFDLDDVDLGRNIDWNYEYKAQTRTPMGFAPGIDYRDHRLTGDCKFVWEPNRHHQLVSLGRAYRLTGEGRYAESAIDQIESWIAQCPYGRGMNWRSPLELAIRVINWVWTLELIGDSHDVPRETAERILSSAYRHLWEISRKYSRFSSANNHLIGEAAGVFIGSSYFCGLKDSSRWRSESRAILEREIIEQTYADGGAREQAIGYHLFVTQFFLLAALVARSEGEEFSGSYWERLEKMFEYTSAFLGGGRVLPSFGDCDDGYVLDLGGSLGDPETLMAIGAVLFRRPDFRALANGYCEPAFWLLGPEGKQQFEELEGNGCATPLRSVALAESGYYLLQSGRSRESDGVSVVFDCGDLGFKSIAAHGHADALSFTLRVRGGDVLVDPGTYDYFTHQGWRDYFRSTRAHNTIEIDGVDQSETLGLFMWGSRASARCLGWAEGQRGGVVSGEHDGYRRLDDPVTHRRTITLDGDPGEVLISDEILAGGCHQVAMYLHLAEHCRVESLGENRFQVDYGNGTVTIEIDGQLSVTMVSGSENPILGWVSRGYHRKTPSTTLVSRCACEGDLSLCTRILT